MASRIAGVAYFKIDGLQFSLRGAFKVQPNSYSKEAIVGQDSVHGYKEMPVAPFIEGEISDRSQLVLQALPGLTNATVTAELASGKAYILQGAFLSGAPELDATDGKITVKFEGLSCAEIFNV